VDPKEVMFLGKIRRESFLHIAKKVTDEYEFLTDKKFFIVIVNKYFNLLKTDQKKDMYYYMK